MEEIITEDRMHGSIFVLLKRFVESKYNYSAWIELKEAAGVQKEDYQMHGRYPTLELHALVAAAAHLMGLSVSEALEKFGQFLVPDLLLIYRKHMNPSWTTYEVLQNTEAVMHAAVRREDSGAAPLYCPS